MSFRVQGPTQGVVTVTFTGAPREQDWDDYVAAYTGAFASATAPFVLLFDLRQLEWDMASIGVFAVRKLALTRALKAHTLRLVQGVVVHTASPVLAALVTALVRAGGQTAPFHVFASEADVEARVRNLQALVLRDALGRSALTVTPCPYTPARGPGLTWGQLGPLEARVVLVCVMAVQRLQAVPPAQVTSQHAWP
jgi:hypothetical protein